MPPKAKDKKGKQELLPTEDYTRRPLPATEPCDARPTPRREVPVVSAHHSFQEWDEDALADMEWGTAGAETLFEDKDGRCFLPPRMAARVVRWVRPRDLIVQKKDEAGEDGEELRQGGKGANSGVEKGKAAGGAEKGKAKSPKGKDKAPSSEPMVLEDSAADGEGNPLPRVIILPPTEAVPGDNGDGKDRNTGVVDTPDQTPDTASSGTTPPRGFKIGWSREQRQQITSLMRKTTQHLQQQQQQQALTENSSDSNEAPIEERETPPEKAVDGNLVGGNGINVSPQAGGSGETSGFLTDDEIATLGAPSGDDIDPALTAIFKAVGQLSPTLYKTSCPLLWEAIYPKTSDGVPCYNPCGLYAIKLFAAGRWRKVEVDDCIPLDATRSPVIAASEDPVELWPLLLSKALYKLYRLGGYDLAQPQEVTTTTTTVEAVDTTTSSRDDATASSKDEGDGPSPASAPAKDATNGGVATGEINDEGADDEAMDEAEQARFVAFVLHSLAGWIPSVTTGISAETALLEGTPGLTPDDLHLPALPPVDVEEEAARERLEERKRRQALFLHKKRRPRKVERKVVSAEERAEVDSARLRKMRAVTQKLLQGTRREVYLVCMPGKPAYPVLAVCPQVSHENPNTAACQSGPPATTSPTSQQRQREGIPVTAGVGTSSSSTQRQEPSPSSSAAPSTAPTTPMETGVATAANADDEKDQPLGFLLKWEAPITPQQAPSVTSDTETPLGGQQQHERQYEGLEEGGRGGGAGEAGSEETGNRVLYGSGGRPRGHAKETAADATGAAPSSLSKPVCLWLSQREVELAGGTVVRAVTKVDMPAYADVQYHWKPVRPTEDAETPTAGNENAASSKDAKAKAKGKALGKGKDKDKDNAPAKGKAGKGEGNSSSGNSCHEAPSADIAVAEADRSPPGIVMVGGVAVPKGLEGVQARDPGSPPAIFLLVTPSPRPERKPVGQPQAQNQETPELDGALLEPPPAETGSAGNNESRETGNPPEVTVGEQDGNANRDYENSPALQDGRGCEEEKTSSGGADGDNEEEKEVEKEEEEEEEEEEAEIFMCLWVDKPGMGGGVGRTSSRFSAKVSDLYATAVLQEVLPGAQYTRGDFSKPVPGGRVVMCARHDPRRSGLPFTATSAKVRLKKGGTPRVFRVLLQPGVGCCVGFCCTHGIEAGDAGQVWEEAGYNQVTEIGKYEGVRPGEWKFLLRRGFRVTAESSPTHQSEGVVGSAVPEETSISAPEIALEAEGARDEQERAHGSNGDAGDAGTMATAENGGNSVGEALEGGLSPSPVPSAKDYCFVKAILHLPDEESRPSVRLAFVDEDTGLEMVQPTLHTNAVPLKPNKRGYSLLAAACHRARAIPKGAWRLQLLSDRPLLPLVDSLGNREGVTDSSPGPEKGVSAGDVGGESGQDGATTVVPCQERAVYGGIYVPNKYLLFFRDILTCASPLPFAIRLRCSLPGTCLRLKFLDAATGETLRDLRGKHVLQALTVTPPTAPESDPSAPPATEASAKGGSKGKGAASDATEKAVAAAPGKMIVEAAIDWTGMEVPPHLVSKLPHYFQPTPEDLPHYSPPLLEATSRILPRASTSEHPNEHGNGEEEGSRGEGQGGGGGGGGGGVERLRSSIAEDSSPITGSTAVSAGTGQADSSPEEGSNNSAATPTSAKSSLPTGEPLHWWLEIVGAGEVGMAHDTARVDRENAEVESWETAEPGRAARAALLWTQRQASKVARFGNGDTPSPPHYSSAETNASAARANATIDANPSPGAEGYEDWIKARAAAVGVPVALEKERQARRLALSTAPAGGTTMPVAPSSGSSSSAPTSPKQAVLIGEEELKQRAKEREALRHATAEFEKKWEEDRIKTVEAGKEHMAMQVNFMKEREEQIKEGRLPFLRDRDAIVYGMIAEAEARKEALEEERAALETASKGAKGKQAKGKPGKK